MEFLEPGREQAQRRTIVVEGWRIEYAVADAARGDGRWEMALRAEIRDGRYDTGNGAAAPREMGDGAAGAAGDGAAAPRALICFHGFARPLEDMLAWSEVWPEPRCLIAIHLPEHGRSGYVGEGGGIVGEGGERGWGGGQAIPPGLWGVIARRIADQEGAAEGPMDLLGYSIGGRVAMAALVASPGTWGRVVLLAPDGLRKAPLYGLTVHTQVGRWIWRVLDRRAEQVLRVWDRLHRWGLIPKHLHGFAHFHLDRAEMRRMVWRGWRAHRDCWAREAAVAAAMRDHGAPVDLCFGAHDQVIPVRNGRGLAWRLRRMGAKGVRFHVLPAGHNMQRPDVMKTVVERIFQR